MLNIFKKNTKKVETLRYYEVKWLDEENLNQSEVIDNHGLTNLIFGLEQCGCEVLSVERIEK